MPERDRSHLRLVRAFEAALQEFVPPAPPVPAAPGTQLSLFAPRRAEVAVFLVFSMIDEERFVSLFRQIRPRVVVDVRVSPRFDVGRLRRRDVFSLFRDLHAAYHDLQGMATEQAESRDEPLAALFQRRFRQVDISGPVVIICEHQSRIGAVIEAVTPMLPKAEAWDYVAFPPAAP